MKHLLALVICLLAPAAFAQVFINELHYDNTGTDTGEAIELAGPAGTDLSGWSLVLYNGSTGAVYNTTTLSDTWMSEGTVKLPCTSDREVAKVGPTEMPAGPAQ